MKAQVTGIDKKEPGMLQPEHYKPLQVPSVVATLIR